MLKHLRKMLYEFNLSSALPLLLLKKAIANYDVERYSSLMDKFVQVFAHQQVPTNLLFFDLFKGLTQPEDASPTALANNSNIQRMIAIMHQKGLLLDPQHTASNLLGLMISRQWDVVENWVEALPHSHLSKDDANMLAIYMCSSMTHYKDRVPPPERLVIQMIEKFDLDPMRPVSEMKLQFFPSPQNDMSKFFMHDNHNLWNISLQNVPSSKILSALVDRIPDMRKCSDDEKNKILDSTCVLMQRHHSIDPHLLLEMERKGMGVKHMVLFIFQKRHDQDVEEKDITPQAIDGLLSRANVEWQQDVRQANLIKQSIKDKKALSDALISSDDNHSMDRPKKKIKM